MHYFLINEHTTVVPSEIHGLGRIASAPIAKDDIVFVAGGVAIDNQKTKWYKGLLVDRHIVLDLPEGSEYEAYVNHSCEPNVYIDGQIVFRALRDVEPGEFLTVDYGTFMITIKDPIPQCNCGSAQCRGTITGTDYRFLNLPLSWYAQKLLKQDLFELAPTLPSIPDDMIEHDIDKIYQMKNQFSDNPEFDHWYFTASVSEQLHQLIQSHFAYPVEVYYQLSGRQLTPHIDSGRTFCYNYTIHPGGPNVKTRWYDSTGEQIIYQVVAPLKTWHRIQVDKIHDISPIDTPRLSLTVFKK